MLVTEFLSIDHFAETMTAVVVEDDTEAGRKKAMFRCEEMVKEAFCGIKKVPDVHKKHQGRNIPRYHPY